MDDTTKQCSRCGDILPKTSKYFQPRSDRPGKFLSWCKACSRDYQKSWEKKNPDKVKARMRHYRQTHLELCRAKSREYNRTHGLKMANIQRKFRMVNPQKSKEYYYRNPERYRRKQRVAHHRRRNAEGIFTADEIQRQYNQQHGLCFWCGAPIAFSDIHADHIIPVSRYGTNWIANLVCSCAACNLQKGNKLPFVEWIPPNCIGR